MFRYITLCAVMLLSTLGLQAQERELIPLGDMEQWLSREVKESRLIGGNVRTLYEIAPQREMERNEAYINNNSPWSTSSVYARVSGINKGSVTVFPEEREQGNTVARLECRLENVKVLGMINISAMATGTIFTGGVIEPIRDTDNPQAKLNSGIPFTGRPSALVFDYKLHLSGSRIYDAGIGSSRDVEGVNAAEVAIILQRRWEDESGNIYAERIATGWEQMTESSAVWRDDYAIELIYGDATQSPKFEDFMGLIVSDPIYAMNSHGVMVPVQEIGWAAADTEPTHLFARFSASYGGAYIGAEGTTLWVDNVALQY